MHSDTGKTQTPRRGFIALRCAIGICALLLVGGDSDVVRKRVNDGIDLFNKNDFNDAAKAFADAETLAPKDLRIKFNRACAEARIDNREGAFSLLKAAAAARDPKLASAAHYNLGSLQAIEGRAIFIEGAAEVRGSKREKGLKHLANAVRHFRDCLAVDPKNMDARKNIEVIRSWQARMRKVWKKHDEQRKKDQETEESLARFLTRLDLTQHEAFDLNAMTKRLEVAAETRMDAQAAAAKELPELREKLAKQFTPDPQLPEEQQQAIAEAQQAFAALSNQLEQAMGSAADTVSSDVAKSMAAQVNALDRINQMYLPLGSFPDDVGRALQIQSQLNSNAAISIIRPTRQADGLVSPQAGPDQEPEEFPVHAGNVLLERETRVAAMAQQLAAKAEQFREALAQQPPQGPDAAEQIAGYTTAIERAIKWSPRLNKAVDSASQNLLNKQVSAATPAMKEAAAILQKIMETMPRQNNGGGGKDDEQQEQDDENKGGNDGPLEDEDSQEKDPSENEPQQQQQQQQEIRDREEAEAMLRKVRDREQNLKDLKAQLQQMRTRASKVERDW